MPQIGWLEILAIIIISILVLGPKEFPVALKKIGSYVGKIKSIFSNFQGKFHLLQMKLMLKEILLKKTM